jgi:spermidine/putrescine ABC transporter ATP-binding subunit
VTGAGNGVSGASVTVRDLYKSFGPVKAVNGVSLEMAAGEFVALLGPSGSGKTTILMSIAGFETPDAGEILIGGRDIIPEPPHKRSIGMVFQRYALFPHMTVAENVGFPLKMRKVAKDERAKRVARALELVRLSGYGSRRVTQLSGGQQQRVALARAVVFDPPVLLMDEPLGALDKRLREEMQIELKHIQQQLRTTVVYVTHDQDEALTMADRIAVIHEGLLQQFAPPREVYERPANAFVAGFVGETNFIEGALAQEPGSGWRLRVAGDQLIPLEGAGEPGWIDGLPVSVAVRPEALRLTSEGAGIPGRVTETIYGGGSLACVIELAPGLVVTARESTDDAPLRRPGDSVVVSWPAGRGRVFTR